MYFTTIMFRVKIRQSPFYFSLWPGQRSVTSAYGLSLPSDCGASDMWAARDRTPWAVQAFFTLFVDALFPAGVALVIMLVFGRAWHRSFVSGARTKNEMK